MTALPQRPPEPIGRYELLQPLAPGSIGSLWVGRIAWGAEEGRVVTVRRIPRPYSLDQASVDALSASGFAAMELRNPRVAAVLDVVVSEREIALISEHIPGTLLHEILLPQAEPRFTMSPAIALRIVRDALEALDAVREAWAEVAPGPVSGGSSPGVHGALVPDGILLADFGESMLLETGFAATAMSVPLLSGREEALSYRAPEQLGEGVVADERTDVFSAGILLWELLSRRPLFGSPPTERRTTGELPDDDVDAAARAASARRNVLSMPILRLDAMPDLKGSIDKKLADFVARCLERDRSLRYQSLRECLTALSALPVAQHSEVAALLLTLRSGVDSAGPRSALSSNRPTMPPVEDRATGAFASPVHITRPAPSAVALSAPEDGRDLSPTLDGTLRAVELPKPTVVESVEAAETPPSPFGTGPLEPAMLKAPELGEPEEAAPVRKAGATKAVVIVLGVATVILVAAAVLKFTGSRSPDRATAPAPGHASSGAPAAGPSDEVPPSPEGAQGLAAPPSTAPPAAEPAAEPPTPTPSPGSSAPSRATEPVKKTKKPFRPTGI